MRSWSLAVPALAAGVAAAPAQDCAHPLIAQVGPLVEKGACIQWAEPADLDRDGDQDDLVLVLERPRPPSADAGDAAIHRSLLVFTGQAGGGLRLDKRNDKIVPCTTCFGTCGDPLSGLNASDGTFTVELEEGCTAWQGKTSYTFGYSRRDKTWQLVRVVKEETFTRDPGRSTRETATPPRDFGKIDLADFDPDNWKGQGAK